MIRHGTLSPFIDLPTPAKRSIPHRERDGVSPPFAACLKYFQGSTGRCPSHKIKIGRRFAGNRRGSQMAVAIVALAAIADAGPIG